MRPCLSLAGVKSQSTAAPPGDGALLSRGTEEKARSPAGWPLLRGLWRLRTGDRMQPTQSLRQECRRPLHRPDLPTCVPPPAGGASAPVGSLCAALYPSLRHTSGHACRGSATRLYALDYSSRFCVSGQVPGQSVATCLRSTGFQALCWAPAAWRGPDTLVGERDNERNHR